MSEHTKEQWLHGGTQISTKEDLIRIFSESVNAHVGDIRQYFMEIYSEDGKRIAFLAGPTAHENARRIAASVNACADVSTENLEENKPIKEGLIGLNARIRAAEQQRDELLAALKGILDHVSAADAACGNSQQRRAIKRAIDAIANVK